MSDVLPPWSNRDVAAAWGCDEHTVRDMLAGERPIHIGDIDSLGPVAQRYYELAMGAVPARRVG